MYDVVRALSLAAAFPERQVIGNSKRIGAITVLRLPAGATFDMRIGNGQQIPVSQAGAFEGFNPNKEGNQGLFVTNPVAQPGVTVDLLVGYVDDEYLSASARQNT